MESARFLSMIRYAITQNKHKTKLETERKDWNVRLAERKRQATTCVRHYVWLVGGGRMLRGRLKGVWKWIDLTGKHHTYNLHFAWPSLYSNSNSLVSLFLPPPSFLTRAALMYYSCTCPPLRSRVRLCDLLIGGAMQINTSSCICVCWLREV